MAITNRAYTSGFSILNLGGADVGVLKSVKGGTRFAEVISATGPDYYRQKQIGATQLEPFTIQLDFSMNQVVYDWISESWEADIQRKNGTIKVCDYRMGVLSKREFSDAMISEVTIPSMDAEARGAAAYFTIKIQPENVQYGPAVGNVNPNLGQSANQRSWLPQNFQLVIDGLDCSQVSRVDAFTVKIEMTNDPVSGLVVPAKVDFPNLRITFAEASAQTWIDWHESFVVQGNNGEAEEKNGALIFQGAGRSTALGRINFFNLGIFRLDVNDDDGNSNRVRRGTAELYCERMEFQYGVPTP